MAELPGTTGPVDRRVGARIRERRELLGLSDGALAARLGCAVDLIQDYEAGRARVGATTLMMLAQLLGVDIGYFLRGLFEDTPPPSDMERLGRDELLP